jgi:hypothetical protein
MQFFEKKTLQQKSENKLKQRQQRSQLIKGLDELPLKSLLHSCTIFVQVGSHTFTEGNNWNESLQIEEVFQCAKYRIEVYENKCINVVCTVYGPYILPRCKGAVMSRNLRYVSNKDEWHFKMI